MKNGLLIISIIFFSNVFGQLNFQKTFLFNDTVAVIQNVYETDSCFYFSATTGKHPSRFDFLFGKLNLDGSIEFTNQIETLDNDQVYFSKTELDTNYRGNLIVGYSGSPDIGLSLPKFLELDFYGNVVDSFYITHFHEDEIRTSLKQVISVHSDSTYIGFGSYYEGNSNGAIVFKFNQLGDVIWSKKYFTGSSFNNLSQFYPHRILSMENGTFLLSVTDYRYMGLSNDPQSWAKIHFYSIDGNGIGIYQSVFQDSPVCFGGFALSPDKEGNIYHTYLESKINYDYSWPEFEYRPIISKLDSNFQQIWKDTLRTQYYINLWEYATPSKLIVQDDNSVVGAFNWSNALMYDSTIWNTLRYIPAVKLFKYDSDGSLIWERKYNYQPIKDSINEPYYTLLEIEKTNDNGFIVTGYVDNYDSLNVDAPAQIGYVLKANCLGFIGLPEAFITHKINENFYVEFYNSSLQAGSFEWDFGDGTPVLWTGENDDTISHKYNDFGPFWVTLIAHGCNGESDTIKFMVQPALHLDPSVITDGQGYFAIFPNPVISGNKLIVYINGIDPSLGNVSLELYNQEGKLIQTYKIGYEEGSYLIDSNISQGMYHINLIQENKILQSRKLIIK